MRERDSVVDGEQGRMLANGEISGAIAAQLGLKHEARHSLPFYFTVKPPHVFLSRTFHYGAPIPGVMSVHVAVALRW